MNIPRVEPRAGPRQTAQAVVLAFVLLFGQAAFALYRLDHWAADGQRGADAQLEGLR